VPRSTRELLRALPRFTLSGKEGRQAVIGLPAYISEKTLDRCFFPLALLDALERGEAFGYLGVV